MRKVYINEDKLKLLEYYCTPDQTLFDDNELFFDDDNAIPFIGFDNLECEFGDWHQTHNDVFKRLNHEFDDNDDWMNNMSWDDNDEELNYNSDEKEPIIKGRVWVGDNVVAFWDSSDYNPCYLLYLINICLTEKDYIDLEKDIYIVYCGDVYDLNCFIRQFCTDKDEELFEHGFYLKKYYSEYEFDDDDDSYKNVELNANKEEEDKMKQIHLMNQKEKRNAFANFRNAKEKKLANKLTSYDEDGEFKSEMPLAQWRALHSTSENKFSSNNLLIENYFNKDRVSEITYSVEEPDESDYDEESYDSYEEFLLDNTLYDVECLDYEGEELYSDYNLTLDDLSDLFDENIINMIKNKEGYVDGNEYTISDLMNTTPTNMNDVDEVNRIAKLIFDYTDEYYKDLRGYILTDGDILAFGDYRDHLSITSVDGMNVGRFVGLGNIRIGKNSFELAKMPTYEQKMQLIKLINSYSDSDLYVDIIEYNGRGNYGDNLTSAHYISPDYHNVLGEIGQFFSDGIKLKGGYGMYESRNMLSESLSPNDDDEIEEILYGMDYSDVDSSDRPEFSPNGFYDVKNGKKTTYEDSDAFAFVFINDKLYVGECKQYHDDIYDNIVANMCGFNSNSEFEEELESYGDNHDELKYEQAKSKLEIINSSKIEGRIWIEKEYISFWNVNLNVNLVKNIVNDLKKYFNRDFNNLKLACNDGIFDFNEFIMDNDTIKGDEDEFNRMRQIHLMNQKEKRNALKGYRSEKEQMYNNILKKSGYDTIAQWRASQSTSENSNKCKKVINEGYDKKIDMDKVNTIEYEIYEPDEDDYNENEYKSYYDSYDDYCKSNTTYDIELFDINYERIYYNTIDQIELDDYFDDDIVNKIINKEGKQEGDDKYILDNLINTNIDIDNVNEVIYMTKCLFNCVDDYYKGLGGYILTDGTLVDLGDDDHNSITMIDGMTVDKFVSLGNIRIRYNNIYLCEEPTYEQENILKKLISSYSDDEVFVDIIDYDGNIITSAEYEFPDYHLVIGEIDRYFSEGLKLRGGYDIYESKFIKENLENELAPSEVDLRSFKVEKKLNTDIWDGEYVNSMVRLKLLDIADDFFETLNVRWIKPKDIILTGSICNYNWSEYSDIDLHIIIDFKEVDKNVELVKDYFNCKKNEWNNDHDELEIHGFPVELYVQDIGEVAESDGIYSLEKNKWIHKPSKKDSNPLKNKSAKVKLVASSIMTKIDNLFDEYDKLYDKHKLEELSDDVDKLLDKIKNIRKNSLSEYGEYSVGNICYKVLRRFDYLDRLWDLKIKIYDKINSIE